VPRATSLNPIPLNELAKRLPDNLEYGRLVTDGPGPNDGVGRCTVGFLLHEAGVPDECMYDAISYVKADCLPKPLLEKLEHGTTTGPDGRVVLASEICATLWNQSMSFFGGLMNANDLAAGGHERRARVLNFLFENGILTAEELEEASNS
jgi:hypothetical protein